jgi:hypothetical protein
MGRIGQPEEIAEALVRLLPDEAPSSRACQARIAVFIFLSWSVTCFGAGRRIED